MSALTQSLAGWSRTSTARVTPTADAGVLEWQREVEVMLRAGHRVGHMTEWGGKLVGATVRVATSLHFAEHEGEQWRPG